MQAAVVFVWLFLSPALRAQTPNPAWPAISPEELALKDNPASRGSHAMILSRDIVIDDVHSFQTEYSRIKIFDEEGKKYADVEIPYFEKETQIEDIRARTVRPDGTTLEFQGEVYDRIVAKAKKLKYKAKVFTLADVQAGYIIEYSYRIRWHWKAPECFRDPSSCGYIQGVFSMRTAAWAVQQDLFTRRAHFTIHPYPKANLRWSTLGLSEKAAPQRSADGSFEMNVENLPAFEEEELMQPEAILRSRVDFYYLAGSVYSSDSFWGAKGKEAYDNLEIFLSKHKKADRMAKETVATNDPLEVKLRKLYVRAQQVRNLSFERSRTKKETETEHLNENKNVDDILEHGYAAGNEINALFVALARAAGLEAHAVWLTSRATNYFRSSLLDWGQLNSNVVLVRTGGKQIYLDPATHLCPYPLLPWEESNAGGVELGQFNGSVITTAALASADATIERKTTLHMDKDGILAGQIRASFTGQEALTRRLGMIQEDTAGRRKELEDEAKTWLPVGATVDLANSSGWENPDEPLRAEFNVSVPNLIATTAHRIMLPLAVSVAGRRNPLQHASRVHPVYFSYPYQEMDEVRIELPANYQVEALPAPHTRQDGSLSYEISSVQQEKSIVLKRRFAIDSIYYRPEVHIKLRAFFDEVISNDGERAVLKLVESAAAH